MSVVVTVKKKSQIVIASDTQANFGNMKVSARHLVNHKKIYGVADSFIGIVGWQAIGQVVEHLIHKKPEIFGLNSRMQIFDTLLELQGLLKQDYYIETEEDKEQPVESNQITALVANRSGIFEIDTYREVQEFNDYTAIGSGNKYALGAMHALYDLDFSAAEIAKAGIHAAAEYDDGCSLPLMIETFDL
jgi:ATP-dependent protease HslVU (ClpYQ) peptidase subunit